MDKLETEVQSLISKIQEKTHLYEAYKEIITPILRMKDSLKTVKSAIDRNGPLY
ncbi:hypothetical protein [Borrelia hispanica]|uniref:hypothetical protein n=1 Tax=Borrelia hispanica TaxID=40835 RepID=UPI0004B3F5A0|nr:hypothetical protein [Borrelia hispanica]